MLNATAYVPWSVASPSGTQSRMACVAACDGAAAGQHRDWAGGPEPSQARPRKTLSVASRR
eukprot:4174186-Pleurochrysis_carterae.AAC.2